MEKEEESAAKQTEQDRKCEEDTESEISVDDYRRLVMQMRKANLLLQQITEIPLGELTMLLTISRMSEETGEAKVSCLGERMKLSRPAVSRMLHVLEKKGYIEMQNGREDQRYLFVRLMDRGRECLKEEMQDGYRVLRRVRDRMGEQKLYDFLCSYNQFHTLLAEEIINLHGQK